MLHTNHPRKFQPLFFIIIGHLLINNYDIKSSGILNNISRVAEKGFSLKSR
jgi:hypothetical protein